KIPKSTSAGSALTPRWPRPTILRDKAPDATKSTAPSMELMACADEAPEFHASPLEVLTNRLPVVTTPTAFSQTTLAESASAQLGVTMSNKVNRHSALFMLTVLL